MTFYWLKEKELAIGYYHKSDTFIIIGYDINTSTLRCYSWDNEDDRSLISLIINAIEEKDYEEASHLICSDYLISIIDKYYSNENN